MSKERFLIVAVQMPVDCFGRFSETANCAAIDVGKADSSDPYSWIEASFEFQLVRYREATHICSFTPSARQIWLQNYFVGIPNAAWQEDGDPDGLEYESGGEVEGYGTYRDEYDSRFVCETFTIDTMRDLDSPMRKPRNSRSEAGEIFHDAIWKAAEDVAREIACNGLEAPICDPFRFRQWQREQLERTRARSGNALASMLA